MGSGIPNNSNYAGETKRKT